MEIAVELLALGAATVGESGARRMHPRIRPAWPGAAVAGPAYPVRCTPGDNLAIHVGVTRAPAGSVLVADVGGQRELGYWGEVLTTAAEARGLVGLVIDGCVRDAAALAAHGFPVFSTGLAPPARRRSAPGRRASGSPSARSRWRPATGSSRTSTVSPWCPEEPWTRCVPPRAVGRRPSSACSLASAGETTVDLLGLDASLVEDGPTG